MLSTDIGGADVAGKPENGKISVYVSANGNAKLAEVNRKWHSYKAKNNSLDSHNYNCNNLAIAAKWWHVLWREENMCIRVFSHVVASTKSFLAASDERML